MKDTDGVLLSVRAEARQLVAPDYAVLDGLFERTAGSKVEAVGSVTASLDRLTADLAARGGVPFDEATGRRPLTWSAYSSATHEESYHDKETGRLERTGQVTATVTSTRSSASPSSARPVRPTYPSPTSQMSPRSRPASRGRPQPP